MYLHVVCSCIEIYHLKNRPEIEPSTYRSTHLNHSESTAFKDDHFFLYPSLALASTPPMATSSKILSLNGKGLKLDSRTDIEPWLKAVDPTVIEEIHFGGNTLGVEASRALAEFLEKTTVLKVRTFYLAC